MNGPAVSVPARRPGSLRRTTHLDITPSSNVEARFVGAISGAGRDLLTRANGSAAVIAAGAVTIRIGDDGSIVGAELDPDFDSADALLGGRLGPGFRACIEPALREGSGTPFGLLLSDLTGAPAGMRYGLVRRGIVTRPAPADGDEETVAALMLMPPSCSAWRAGGTAARARAAGMTRPPLLDPPAAPPLDAGDDALAWHALPPLAVEHGRRMRRIDLWRDGEGIRVDAFFRDVNKEPDGGEVIVHEYALTALIDADTGRLDGIVAEPHVLPFDDCPFAAGHVGDLVGVPVTELAIDIHSRHGGEKSCTHLNDMVRFLGDVPALSERLA
jgi:Protein of unknown function (DUF2889)